MFALYSSALLLISALSLTTPALGKTSAIISKGYYTGWNSDDFPLDKVSWNKYTHLTYAFAITTPDGKLSLEGSNPSGLAPFVQAAHDNGVKASVGIGGWTGSMFFSTSIGSPENRTAFVKTVTDFATQYNLDGLDMDWEYPNRQGIGCNAISPDDTANLLAFLQELRKDPIGSKLSLSAAVSLGVYNDASGSPSTDVSGFGDVLDYMVIMGYDIWGSWSSSVGPNAPLNDTCAAPANQQGSAIWSVQKWNSAGIPFNKIVLGVPGYGHAFTVRQKDAFQKNSNTKLTKYPPFDKEDRARGDAWSDPAGKDVCGTENPAGDTYNFWGLVENGFLNTDVKRYDVLASDWGGGTKQRRQAYVYNPDKEVMVSYDDANAADHKGHFIKNFGLAGFSLWHAGSDYNDILLDSIRKAAGFKN
ncbi:hypothetical protein VNI00_004850 [Paramarasmius palmivorus]|uniref:GH18 domain-containing protein n=1 Tax=Paramarasmius palmivorus TaxID=297713 RepID=A0AAW0DIR6_9AGAR